MCRLNELYRNVLKLYEPISIFSLLTSAIAQKTRLTVAIAYSKPIENISLKRSPKNHDS
ncbi:hypothetical protein [Pseudanabaena sp. lw0831]|uniref:hypothetical protein n=1 Tax=Pseudanabaena sp. lw0831 TaxID=1357935 RepID=UPI0019156BDB|nr:hypothetical protein [Pseudanabaena sp. lw0831]